MLDSTGMRGAQPRPHSPKSSGQGSIRPGQRHSAARRCEAADRAVSGLPTSAVGFDLPRSPALRIEADGLEIDRDAVLGLKRLSDQIGTLAKSDELLTFHSALLRKALQEHLLQRDEANTLLGRVRDEGFAPLERAVNAALHARVTALVDDSPFPLSSWSEADLKLPAFGVWHDTTLCQTWGQAQVHDLSAVARLSPTVRRWVWHTLQRLPLPCIDALYIHDTYYYSDGVSSALHALASLPGAPSAADYTRAFERLMEDCEMYDEDEEAEPRHHYVGGRSEFIELCHEFVPLFRRRGRLLPGVGRKLAARPPPAQKPADEAWIDLARRAQRIPSWLTKNALSFHFNAEEQRPLELSRLIALHPSEFAVADHFFERSDDGSGEMPGVSLDLGDSNEEGSMVSFAVLPVLTASTFAAIDSLSAKHKRKRRA